MEYAEFLESYDSNKYVVIHPASANDNLDYVYLTPDEMIEFLNDL